jgi:hypothetical protein
MYYSNVEIEYVGKSFSAARTDLALKLLNETTYAICVTPSSLINSSVCFSWEASNISFEGKNSSGKLRLPEQLGGGELLGALAAMINVLAETR